MLIKHNLAANKLQATAGGKAIKTAALAFDANNFGAQYYGLDRDGDCQGEPDCLSVNENGDFTFHPRAWPLCGEVVCEGETAIELYRSTLFAYWPSRYCY